LREGAECSGQLGPPFWNKNPRGPLDAICKVNKLSRLAKERRFRSVL
jgi:hypothetical protein